MRHLSDTEIIAYASDRLDDADATRIDEHSAECTPCRERLRGALYLQANTASVIDCWTAWGHGEAARRLRLAYALRTAAERDSSLVGRATRWLRSLGSEASVAGRVALDSVRNVGLSAARLGEGWNAGLRPAMQGVASPDAEAAMRSMEEGCRLLAEGDVGEAVQAAQRAAKLDVRTARASTLEIRGPKNALLRVVADSRRNRVAVAWSPTQREMVGTLLMLIPESAGAAPMISRLETVPGASYLIAEFESVPNGEYTLEIEPRGSQWSDEDGVWIP